jgi:hypothetical protein
MNLGAEPKKVAILAVLLVVAAYLVYNNIVAPAGEETTSAAAPAPVNPAPIPSLPAAAANAVADNFDTAPENSGQAENNGEGPRSARAGDGGNQEFRPSLRPREGKDKLDPAKIDPTLELYRLERLREVAVSAGGRNVFEFGAAAPPKVPDVKILPKVAVALGPPVPPPPPPPPGPKVDPPKPQMPPIPLKFYGFSQKEFEQRSRNGGARRGLFLRGGEEIFVASVGDLIDRRYKVIRIEADKATLEDTQFENEQTIPIERSPDARE